MEFNESAVGATIKRLRESKGLTQEVLSGLAGINRPHLTAIETGVKMPKLDTLWRIAAALDTMPHELILAVEETINEYKK